MFSCGKSCPGNGLFAQVVIPDFEEGDELKESLEVNPVPRTYVRGFGALPLQGGRNIHPRAYAWGVLWYGVKGSLGPTGFRSAQGPSN